MQSLKKVSIAVAAAFPIAMAHAAAPSGVSFTSPASGATVSGTIGCQIGGSGIAYTRFYVDGRWINTDTASPYQCAAIDTTKLSNGTHTLRAMAYSGGNEGTTRDITINVRNGATPTPTPTPTPSPTPTPTGSLPAPTSGPLDIWFKAPLANQTVSGVLQGTGCYIKGTGVAKVGFFVDGAALNTDTNMSDGMSCVLDTRKFANGKHTLTAVATGSAGGTYTEKLAINIQNSGTPTPTPTPTPGTAKIEAADIMYQASADTPFSGQGYSVAAYGASRDVSELGDSGVTGSRLPNGETMRFGKQADPADGAKKALAFQLGVGDPITQGSHRAEIEFNKKLKYGGTYWFAFRAYVYDWGTLPSDDEQLFGFQFHNGDTSQGYSPSVSLTSYGRKSGGRTYQMFVAYSTSSSPSLSSQQGWWSQEIALPFGRWVDFVVKVRAGLSNGMAQLYMDGQQVASYSGPVGFYTPNLNDYAKFGYYNWSPYRTPRKVLLDQPVVVADPTGSKYTAADLRGFINQ